MADKKILSQLSPAQTLKIVTKRLPKVQKSLALLVVSLVGVRLVVELKNDIEITGVLEESDENMNMTIQNAIQILPNGTVRELEIVFVNGSHVRYVHIPPEINAVRHLNEYVSD